MNDPPIEGCCLDPGRPSSTPLLMEEKEPTQLAINRHYRRPGETTSAWNLEPGPILRRPL